VEVRLEALARFFEGTLPHLNEVQRRVVAGAAAQMLGQGGKTAVATACAVRMPNQDRQNASREVPTNSPRRRLCCGT
jgi:hypothetical protein